MLRRVRKWITAQVRRGAVVAAPRVPTGVIDSVIRAVARWGPWMPVVGRHVARNMRAAGVYGPDVLRDYFHNLGRHFSGALHALRCAVHTPATGLHPEMARLVAERVVLDGSVARVNEAARRGAGVILVGPHVVDYLVFLARLNEVVPLTVYLRHAKRADDAEMKHAWYRAANVQCIAEPAQVGGPLGRIGRMTAALNEGRVLYITPDLPQKRHDGTPVRLLDREVYLPAGPAMLAVRTWAPLLFLTARPEGERIRLMVDGPFVPTEMGRGRAARRQAVREHLQWFADGFGEFLKRAPALWYLWGDKRWSRVFAGDARYVRRLDGTGADVARDAEVAGVT